MNSKKAITLLVLATLLMSLVPVISVNAIGSVTVSDYTVNVDDTITVTGSGVTAGASVEVYWDLVQPWDGTAGLLNTTKAKASGSFECEITIPEAVGDEDHYVWAKDVGAGTTDFDGPITVEPSMDLSPNSGLPDDEITITGYGYAGETDLVAIEYFNGVWLDLITSYPETDELGTWTAKFDIPTLGYGTYEIYAEDDDGYNSYVDLVVGASITLDIDEGPEGSLVKINGRGFNDGGDVVTGNVMIGGEYPEVVTEDEIGGSPTYSFQIQVIVPSIGEGDYEFNVTVGNDWATADFTVNGESSIEVTPTFGVQGSTIQVSGGNFTQWDEAEVSVELWTTAPAHVVDIKTFETDEEGEFSGTFTVPARSNGKYRIYAFADGYGVEAYTDFKIGSVIVILSSSSGPSGKEVILTGTGFEYSAEWNATIDGELLVEGMSDGSGNLEEGVGLVPTFWVPSLAPGLYTVEVMDETGTTVEVDYEITETTMVTTDPLVGPVGYNMSIVGTYFAQDEGADLDFVLYNTTDDWDISTDVEYEGSPVDISNEDDMGEFTGYWVIPELDLGVYTLNVTDEYGLFAQYLLQVVPKTVSIEPRKSSFRIGETVGFTVDVTFKSIDSYVKIWDPTGNLYWETDVFDNDAWVRIGTIYRLPLFEQVAGGNLMTLLEDAPLGTWSWAWYDADDDELDSGTFTVEASSEDVLSGQVEDLNNKLTDLASQVDDVSSEFDDVKSDIADVAAIAQQAVAAANAATEAVNSVAQTANTASQAAADAADAAEAARDAANGLTTLVYGAIGAALVAALAAIVSLMQISKRIAG